MRKPRNKQIVQTDEKQNDEVKETPGETPSQPTVTDAANEPKNASSSRDKMKLTLEEREQISDLDQQIEVAYLSIQLFDRDIKIAEKDAKIAKLEADLADLKSKVAIEKKTLDQNKLKTEYNKAVAALNEIKKSLCERCGIDDPMKIGIDRTTGKISKIP